MTNSPLPTSSSASVFRVPLSDRLDLEIKGPDDLAALLEDTLTWRQLRKLAKRNHIRQYSYLGKRGLSMCLAYQAINRIKRYNVPITL